MNKNKKLIFAIGGAVIVLALAYFVFDQDVLSPEPSLEPQQNQNQEEVTEEAGSKEEFSELKIEVLAEGTGAELMVGYEAVMHYTAMLEDRTVVDSSVGKSPFVFVLGTTSLIEGFNRGVVGMKVGEKRRLYIPSALAYGDQARGTIIPASSNMVFEVELLSVEKP